MSGAYQTGINQAVEVLHPVRDVNGTLVPGLAASLTKALLEPDRSAAAEPITLSDIGTTGWVKAVVTPTAELGTYTLQLTNPGFPLADGRFEEYSIVVSSGFLTAGELLTTLDRVRIRMQLQKPNQGGLYAPAEASPIDSLLNAMISEVSDEYQSRCGRVFLQAGYVDYLDGNYQSRLPLKNGPLVSITSLETVAYSDNGAGGVTETRTLVAPNLYFGAGYRGIERHMGRGAVEMAGGALFARGMRNYRVSYTAGFSSVPEGVAGLATQRVLNDFYSKDTKYLLGKTIENLALTLLTPKQMRDEEERALNPYVLESF